MEGERIIEMMERIHDYIHGRLSTQEEYDLWIEFVKEPRWYQIFDTELHLTHLAKNIEKDYQSSPSLSESKHL